MRGEWEREWVGQAGRREQYQRLLVSGLFLLLCVAVIGILPLWLDEILQLLETRDTGTWEMLRQIRRNSGAVPLGYLVQQFSLQLLGYSTVTARVPAALFGVLDVWFVGVLASKLRLKRPWLAMLLFALLPNTLRYANEARVYSQALFLVLLCSILFLRLQENITRKVAIGYAAVLVLAIYTQPYTISIAIAHLASSLWTRQKRLALTCAVTIAVAGLAFLPWYLWSAPTWSAGLVSEGFHVGISFKTPLMLFREIPGAGYWGSCLLVPLVILGWRSRLMPAQIRNWLAALILIPVLFGLLCDAYSGYFVAARQFIWVLPFVAILAASASERRFSRAGAVLSVLLVVVCAYQDYRFFHQQREDWAAAANAMEAEREKGECVSVAPEKDLRIYAFFRPQLQKASCAGREDLLVLTPATTERQQAASRAALRSAGFVELGNREVGRSVLISFELRR